MTQNMVILFGGQSPEHDISIKSFSGVFPALPKGWQLFPVFIDKQGAWWLQKDGNKVIQGNVDTQHPCALTPGVSTQANLVQTQPFKHITGVDFVFVILHGKNGEDGRIQGYLDMLGIPYSGCDAEASAIGMNKVLTKHVCEVADIPVVPWVEVHEHERKSFKKENVPFSFPWIVKPVRVGSSIGVSRVEAFSQIPKAFDEAFTYDDLVLVEACIQGREFECAVLEDPDTGTVITGEPCEIILPAKKFFTYEDKYFTNVAKFVCPIQDLETAWIDKLKSISISCFQIMGGSGFARCDFLMEGNSLYLNELNTIPGFTPKSRYPWMLEVAGLPREKVLDKIVRAGVNRKVKA